MTKKTGKPIPPLVEEVLPTLAQLHIPTVVAVPFGDPDTQRYAVGINAVKGGLKVFVERCSISQLPFRVFQLLQIASYRCQYTGSLLHI